MTFTSPKFLIYLGKTEKEEIFTSLKKRVREIPPFGCAANFK
jgi:hypothetical protein